MLEFFWSAMISILGNAFQNIDTFPGRRGNEQTHFFWGEIKGEMSEEGLCWGGGVIHLAVC